MYSSLCPKKAYWGSGFYFASVVGELWWAAEALLIFCLSEEKWGSGIVKPITHISGDLGATWGGAESCLCYEEQHRVPWNGEQQKGPSVWGVGSNTAPAHSGLHRTGFYIWELVIKQEKNKGKKRENYILTSTRDNWCKIALMKVPLLLKKVAIPLLI